MLTAKAHDVAAVEAKIAAEPESSWQTAAARKRASVAQIIPTAYRLSRAALHRWRERGIDVRQAPYACGLLQAQDLVITDIDDVEELLGKIASGTWTSVSVMTAYIGRASIAHQLASLLLTSRISRLDC